ncbi:MAG TPA: tRNA (adenosine(37)-N6)-dimethylallyltransferase MiaA [Solirubrobacteraceae bacterium]|nr:tRNA (adenosine(37)-N6)-dimethylallyltransferase MiaA [Solirubrobacteraceae bacterium]
MPRPAVIALFGPTGVGKTAVAVALAQALRERGEDPVGVSADALQLYRHLETLTGAPTRSDQAALEHRLVSVLSLQATFSAGQYAQRAHDEIDGLLAAGRRPIVVGGTGLYLRAALTDLSMRPPPLPGSRERWTAELERVGPRALHALLRQRAPGAAARVDPGDRQRIIRALELLDAGELEPVQEESQLWTDAVRHPTLLVGLVMERSQLYDRIERRVDAMLAAGAQEEVRRAAEAGVSPTVAKALGFQELLSNDLAGMKRRSRQYARRQLTWMRKLSGIRVMDVTGREAGAVAADVLELWLA